MYMSSWKSAVMSLMPAMLCTHTSMVIFTGLPKHARQLRSQFDQRTLVISNGAQAGVVRAIVI